MLNIKHQRSKITINGFTLIELLVVISIIGILVALGLARYSVAEKGVRDTQRMSDLNQYRIALENYASANNSAYPDATVNGAITILCAFNLDAFKTTYLSGKCLNDPLGGANNTYYYYSNGTDFSLYAVLESGTAGTNYIVCSTGRSGKMVNPLMAPACPALP